MLAPKNQLVGAIGGLSMRKTVGSSQSRQRVKRNRTERRFDLPEGQEASVPAREQSPGPDEAYLDEMLKQTFPASDPLPYESRRRRQVTPAPVNGKG